MNIIQAEFIIIYSLLFIFLLIKKIKMRTLSQALKCILGILQHMPMMPEF